MVEVDGDVASLGAGRRANDEAPGDEAVNAGVDGMGREDLAVDAGAKVAGSGMGSGTDDEAAGTAPLRLGGRANHEAEDDEAADDEAADAWCRMAGVWALCRTSFDARATGAASTGETFSSCERFPSSTNSLRRVSKSALAGGDIGHANARLLCRLCDP